MISELRPSLEFDGLDSALTNHEHEAPSRHSLASADKLAVETVNGHEQYRLAGNLATVTQGKTVITGPQIRFAPDEQIAEVIGVGGMKGTLPDDPKESFDIAWAQTCAPPPLAWQ